MITVLLICLVCGIVGKLILLALRITWGLLRFLVSFLLFPAIIVSLILSGMVALAIPALVIGLIVMVVRAVADH